MEHKYNDQRIADYSSRLARQLTDTYFLTNTTINGRELMTFSPVRQINLFILKDLLASWHSEFAKLQSPYFDYEADEVTQSLGQFMNVLSQHILIRKTDFEPLLRKAITNAIKWSTEPVSTFEQVFLEGQDKVNVEDLRVQLKYLDQDKAPMLEFLDNLHTKEAEPSFILSRLKLFVSAHYRDMSNADELFARLNQLLPLQANELRETPEAPRSIPTPIAQPAPTPAPVATTPEPEKAAVKESVTATVQVTPTVVPQPQLRPETEQTAPKTQPFSEAPKPVPVAVPADKPKPAPAPQPSPVTATAPAIASTTTPPAPAQPVPVTANTPKQTPVTVPQPTAAPVAAPERPLVERLRTERSSLNETLKPAESGSIAAAHGATKIESLKNSISINQRFAFINELFGGDNQAYQQSLSQIDEKPNLESAKSFVENELANQFNWKNKADTVSKLLRLLERKFS